MNGLDYLVIAITFGLLFAVLGFDLFVKRQRAIGRAEQRNEQRRLRREIERQP